MFEKKYPYLATWIHKEGRLELGSDYYSSSILRIINEGGMIWEDNDSVEITKALERGEKYLQNDFSKDFGYELTIE